MAWIGVLTCGHIWTCPTCSERLRTARLAKLLAAVGHGGGVWQMVTLTVRHFDGMPLRALQRGLMRAWRSARQGGATQRIWSERVKASARAIEITRGGSGWHPHLHVLLHTDGFSEEEKETLLQRWLLCVERELGPACVPSVERAIRWSTPIDICAASAEKRARYMVKLGLEVAGEKRGRRGSLSHWDVAALAADGDSQARAWWTEFYRATKGRRMLELDDRAAAYARQKRALDLVRVELNIAEPLEKRPPSERVVVPVDAIELRALREYEQRFDPRILAVLTADVAKSQSPAKCVRAWLDLVTDVLRYHGGDVQSSDSPQQGESRARGDPSRFARAGPSAGDEGSPVSATR